MTASHYPSTKSILRASVGTIRILLLRNEISSHEMTGSYRCTNRSTENMRKSVGLIGRLNLCLIPLGLVGSLLIVRIGIVINSRNLRRLFAFARSKYGLWPTTLGWRIPSGLFTLQSCGLFLLGSRGFRKFHVFGCSIRQFLRWEIAILLLILTTPCRDLFCCGIAIQITECWSCFASGDRQRSSRVWSWVTGQARTLRSPGSHLRCHSIGVLCTPKSRRVEV